MTPIDFVETLKIIIFSSVLFVWVIRYQNIVLEFKQFNYPDWLRDLVGILKIACVVMIMNSSSTIVKNGSLGIAVLMLMAQATHFRNKSKPSKFLPSLILFVFSLLLYFSV